MYFLNTHTVNYNNYMYTTNIFYVQVQNIMYTY